MYDCPAAKEGQTLMRTAHTVKKGPWPIPGVKDWEKSKREFDSFTEHGRERSVAGPRLDRRRRRTFRPVIRQCRYGDT